MLRINGLRSFRKWVYFITCKGSDLAGYILITRVYFAGIQGTSSRLLKDTLSGLLSLSRNA
jgi:hypothetical protein